MKQAFGLWERDWFRNKNTYTVLAQASMGNFHNKTKILVNSTSCINYSFELQVTRISHSLIMNQGFDQQEPNWFRNENTDTGITC